LTPKGIEPEPNFFKGIVIQPQEIARGLLVLADITATRYFKYVPTTMRDPILSAQGDMLRAECFSACNGGTHITTNPSRHSAPGATSPPFSNPR
jgi:hypothetical protein